MSDKLKQTLINVTFAQGEQPDASKLNGAFGQMETALEFINKAIGDINNQQYPHSGISSPLSTLPSSGPSLGRLVGSASWLNPKRIGLVRKTISVDFGAGDGDNIPDKTGSSLNALNRASFRLPFPPVILTKNYTAGGASRKTMGNYTVAYSWDGAPGSFSIGSPGGTGGWSDGSGNLTNRVAYLDLVNSTGDYHVSKDGTITLYNELSFGEGFSVTYTFDTIGDAFTGSTLNVIPDFAQTTTLCTVADNGDGTYNITLPTIEALSSYYFNGSGFSSGVANEIEFNKKTYHQYMQIWFGLMGSPSYGAQCYLPEILTMNLSGSETIPEGYIYIWDETTSQILNGGTFTYLSSSSVKVSGLSLTASSNRYRIIVPGSDIARTVSVLKESYVKHNHTGVFEPDGTYHGDRISHMDLHHLGDEGDDLVSNFPTLVVSEYGPARNPHPQYLHRMGYASSDGGTSDGNRRNALLGNLVLSQNDKTLGNTSDSFGIFFGAYQTYGTAGGKISYNAAEDIVLLEGKGLGVYESAPATVSPAVLYEDCILSSWGTITTAATTPILSEGMNASIAYGGAGNKYITVTFPQPLDHSAYSIQITNGTNGGAGVSNIFFSGVSQGAGSFRIYAYDTTGATVNLDGWASLAGIIYFAVHGGWII